jgi:hypothetical protein
MSLAPMDLKGRGLVGPGPYDQSMAGGNMGMPMNRIPPSPTFQAPVMNNIAPKPGFRGQMMQNLRLNDPRSRQGFGNLMGNISNIGQAFNPNQGMTPPPQNPGGFQQAFLVSFNADKLIQNKD